VGSCGLDAWGTSEIPTKFWSENLKERDHTEDLGVTEVIILEWILGKYGGKLWTRFMWLSVGTVEGFCEYGNGPSGSIIGEKFLH
jgi:hypothetical protein